ncbi:Zeta toxin [Amycolatopsis antarctica]|uniref:Zeta toxin n=1 Tax=Amycolatopsis antarctica TaxID=1854586 RepID=A0A263D388_9PSEU|nr:AAA family ATPase [Amycolatopsis antarctica]OZM71825.1 Zeta toxin [Amycolatopsis antarctica]
MRSVGAETRLETRLAPDDLVVVAGLPGAGKSTLLREARNLASATILDSDQVRDWFSATMPGWVRYRWYRPLVHLAHRGRIVLYAARRTGPVVAHEPATRASTRAMLVLIGLLTGRRRHLLWVSATPGEAEAGQRARGRQLAGRSFARHVRRAERVEPVVAAGGVRGWHSVVVVHRPASGERLVLRPVRDRPDKSTKDASDDVVPWSPESGTP